MKRIYFTLAAMIFFISIQAQEALFFEPVKPKLKLKYVSFALGNDQDMVHGLSSDQMLGMTREDHQYNYSEMGFEKTDVASMVCENPNMRLGLGFQPAGWTNSFIEFSAMAIWDRIDAVYYGRQINVNGEVYNSLLSFKTRTNEANLGVGYVWNKRALNTFGVRLATGANLGYSFGNYMNTYGENVMVKNNESGKDDVMIDHFQNSYNVKNSFYSRAYVEAGLDITFFKRVTVGWVYRHGYGSRATMGAGANGITHKSLRLFMAYNL